jgi:glycosyltransferase involved in cell wall biosynthesis
MSQQAVPTKKILIVTYYWPPSGGSGVQRWLKFVKYLPQFGIKPVVFTPANPAFALRDESLVRDIPAEAEIIRFPIWEPYDAFLRLSKLFGSNKSTTPAQLVKAKQESLFEKLSTWIRGNLFVPDPRRFWVRPSVKFLHAYLKENRIQTIVTTGPPHSMHLIGYKLKKKNPELQWIADFRDPWSGWGLLDSLKVSKAARKLHSNLEHKVLTTADIVTTITPFYVKHFANLRGRKVELLTNGFDEDDFKGVTITRAEKFIIRHVGIINEKCNPAPFMLALAKLMKDDKDFLSDVRMEFIGDVNAAFRSFVERSPDLKDVTFFIPAVPHKQLMKIYGSSSLLLLVLTGYKDAAGYMPGKLFEYIATGLPVLGVGPENGDASVLIRQSNSGKMIDDSDEEGLKKYLKEVYRMWKENQLPAQVTGSRAQYSRRVITESLSRLIK